MKTCRACEINANDEQVKQMPMHTCGKDGPIEEDRPKALPEEKKNTMENMTEKDLAIKMANRALEVPYADPDSDICTISRQFLRALELTASSSVAAPKEEEVKDVYVLIDELHADADYLLSRAIQNPEDKAMLVRSVREKLNLIRQLAVPETTVTDGIKIIKLMTELTTLRQQLKEREEELTILYQDLNEREAECKTLKEGIRKGSELYANLKFDDEPTGYQIALKKIQELEEALKELLPIAERGHVYLESSKYYLYMDTISRAKALLDKH